MAAITIRNLPDEVVEALKQRAKTNSRSMEAEVRDALSRLAAGEELRSGVEDRAERQERARRFSVPASEVMARIAANPPTDEERRVAKEWLEEHNTRPYDDPSEWDDPWERAEHRRGARKSQSGT